MTTPIVAPPTPPERQAPAGPDHPADNGVRRSAVVAGLGILVLALLAVFATFGAIGGPVTTDDPARTAQDILASSGLFRLGIAALVVVVALDVVVAWALLTFFGPVDHRLAMLAAWFRLAYAAVFAVAVGQLLGVLPLLRGIDSPSSLTSAQRNTEALLKIQAFQDIWAMALALFGVHLILIGYLAYRSGYVPRLLGVLLAIAGLGYVIDTFSGLLAPDHPVTISVVTFVGEALFMVWLLVKGRRVTV